MLSSSWAITSSCTCSGNAGENQRCAMKVGMTAVPIQRLPAPLGKGERKGQRSSHVGHKGGGHEDFPDGGIRKARFHQHGIDDCQGGCGQGTAGNQGGFPSPVGNPV